MYTDPSGHCFVNISLDGGNSTAGCALGLGVALGMGGAIALSTPIGQEIAREIIYDAVDFLDTATREAIRDLEDAVNEIDLQPNPQQGEEQEPYCRSNDCSPANPFPGHPNDDSKIIVYHYTDAQGLAGILASQEIWASGGNGKDANYGNGQYFTDISPLDASKGTAGQLSRALWGNPFNQARVQYWVAVDVTDLGVEEVAPVYSNTYGAKHIFLYGSEEPLDISGRIVGSGKTPFKQK